MVAVALPGGGVQKRIGCFLGTRQHWHGICMDDAGKFAAHHFMQMAEKAEAGHIRSGTVPSNRGATCLRMDYLVYADRS